MGNHLFSATDLMSLLLSLCRALLFHSLLSLPPASLCFCFVFVQIPPPQKTHPPLTARPNVTHSPLYAVFLQPVYFKSLHSVPLPHHGPCRPLRLSRGQFSASCSQWDIWVCDVSPGVPFHRLFLQNTRSVSQWDVSISNLTRRPERALKL